MKNSFVVILLVAMVSILSGVGLVLGLGNAINTAISPLALQMMQANQNESRLVEKLAMLEKKYAQLEAKMAERPAAPTPSQVAPNYEDFNKVYDIPDGNSPIIGKKDAPVTIVEFSDFQCPFCQRFFPPAKEAMAAYPDKVRLIIKNFPLPFHPNARPAAKLALAANEQGKYLEMVEELLANGAQVDDAKIKEYAKKIGINADRLAKDFKDKDSQWEQQIQEDEKLLQSVDVRGTPTFFINGKKTNARDANSWKAAIEKALQ